MQSTRIANVETPVALPSEMAFANTNAAQPEPAAPIFAGMVREILQRVRAGGETDTVAPQPGEPAKLLTANVPTNTPQRVPTGISTGNATLRPASAAITVATVGGNTWVGQASLVAKAVASNAVSINVNSGEALAGGKGMPLGTVFGAPIPLAALRTAKSGPVAAQGKVSSGEDGGAKALQVVVAPVPVPELGTNVAAGAQREGMALRNAADELPGRTAANAVPQVASFRSTSATSNFGFAGTLATLVALWPAEATAVVRSLPSMSAVSSGHTPSSDSSSSLPSPSPEPEIPGEDAFWIGAQVAQTPPSTPENVTAGVAGERALSPSGQEAQGPEGQDVAFESAAERSDEISAEAPSATLLPPVAAERIPAENAILTAAPIPTTSSLGTLAEVGASAGAAAAPAAHPAARLQEPNFFDSSVSAALKPSFSAPARIGEELRQGISSEGAAKKDDKDTTLQAATMAISPVVTRAAEALLSTGALRIGLSGSNVSSVQGHIATQENIATAGNVATQGNVATTAASQDDSGAGPDSSLQHKSPKNADANGNGTETATRNSNGNGFAGSLDDGSQTIASSGPQSTARDTTSSQASTTPTLNSAAIAMPSTASHGNSTGASATPFGERGSDTRGTVASEAATLDSSATPSNTAGPAGANNFVHAAQLEQGGSHSQMRIAMQTDDLGAIEMHARVSGDSVGASITVEKRDAHTVLAAELPSLQQALSEKQLRVEQISLLQAPLDATAGHGSASQFGGQNSAGGRAAQNFSTGGGLAAQLTSFQVAGGLSTDTAEMFDSQGRLSVHA